MEGYIKRVLKVLVNNNFAWAVLRPISVLGVYMYNSRKEPFQEEWQLPRVLFPEMKIKNGPFAGVKYPEIDSVGSAIYPKLLGSYERELWKVIDFLKNTAYTEVLDIGCAEGYYAVGLATSMVNARVYAYDTDEKARKLCMAMASLNKVADRVTVRADCTPEELAAFSFTGKGLVICDCEGFEKELFNEATVNNLVNCDLVIETHDFMDITISTYIKEVFKDTHNIISIKSIDDIEKALTYTFVELNGLSLKERKLLVEEKRPAIMEWVVCLPKGT